MSLKTRFTIEYKGSKNKLNKFAYQLIKAGFKPENGTHVKPRHYNLMKYRSIIVFKDKTFMFSYGASTAEIYYKGHQYRAALAAAALPWQLQEYCNTLGGRAFLRA